MQQIKINTKLAKELMFYLTDSHSAYLELAQRKKSIVQRIKCAEEAKRCRLHYKNVMQFARLSTVQH